MAAVAAASLMLTRGWPRARVAPSTMLLLTAMAALWGFLPLASWRFNPVALHYPARLINIALPLWLGGALWAWQYRRAPSHTQGAWGVAIMLNVGNLMWQGSTTAQWLNFRAQVLATLQRAPGLIDYAQAGLVANPFCETPWWLPSLSIAEWCLHGAAIGSLIDAPMSEFSKFNAHLPGSWPPLERYRCVYTQSLINHSPINR